MQRVYLDQWVWVGLARAFHKDKPSDEEADALALAQSAVKLGLASFPLSFFHYSETYTARNRERRRRLADVMADVSKFHSIAPENKLLVPEVDEALHRRFGRPIDRRKHNVFGIGIAHAFGEPDAALPDDFRRDARVEEWVYRWEYLSLAGPQPEVPGSEEIDMEVWKAPAREFALRQEKLAEELQALGYRRDRVADAVAAQEFWNLVESALREAMERAGLAEGLLMAGGKESLYEFMEDVPTRNVALKLRTLRHHNPQQKWTRTDLADIGALAVAVPYCDVVVTEARWADALRRENLDQKYSTKLLRSSAELRTLLSSIA